MGVLAAGDSRQVGRRAWCRRFVFGPGHPPFAGPASNRVALATRAGTPTASWRGPGTPTVRAVRETWGAGRDTHRPRTASRDSHRSSRLIKWVSPLEWLAPSGGCPHSTRPELWVSPLDPSPARTVGVPARTLLSNSVGVPARTLLRRAEAARRDGINGQIARRGLRSRALPAPLRSAVSSPDLCASGSDARPRRWLQMTPSRASASISASA